jgi:hypothetical protein
MLFWGFMAVIALGIAFVVWKLWSDRQADSRYARTKVGADADVRQVLQRRSFTVGTPSDFDEGGLVGHFGWLSGERAWGLRLRNPKSSLRSLEGTSVPVWILRGEEKTWVRHSDGNVRLRAYNSDVSLVLPKGLQDGDQVRLGENVEAPAAA